LGLNLPDLRSNGLLVGDLRVPSFFLWLLTSVGEREVLALALETPDSVCVIDDSLARQIARTLQLRLTGTLGILIDAKNRGIISAVGRLLDQLQSFGFLARASNPRRGAQTSQ
jgi:hypothetical protein